MQMVNPFGGRIKLFGILLVFSFVFTVSAQSQNIFLDDTSGFLTFGQLSQVEHFGGQTIGLNYSFDGETAVGISYGSSTLNNSRYQNVSVHANLLIKKQSAGDPFNLEIIPAFERMYNEQSYQNKSLFSMAAGISKDISMIDSFDMVPRASFSYLVSPSVGITNFLSAGMDMNMGFDLTSNVKFIVNPGVNLRLDNGQYNGVFTSGLLIQ